MICTVALVVLEFKILFTCTKIHWRAESENSFQKLLGIQMCWNSLQMEEDRRLPSLRRDISCTSGLGIREIIVRNAWHDVLFGFKLARLLKFSCNSIATQMSFIVASVQICKWQSQIQLMLQTTCWTHLCPSAFYHHAVSGNKPPADTPEHTETHTLATLPHPLHPTCLHPQHHWLLVRATWEWFCPQTFWEAVSSSRSRN